VPALIVEVLATNIAFVAVALALGEAVLRLVDVAVGGSHRPPSPTRLGAAVLAGFGTCALAGIVLAALHLYRWQAFVVCGAVAMIRERHVLADYGRASLRFPARLARAGALIMTAVVVVVVVFGSQWLAGLAPPTAFDELAYHLPEAHTLADTHVLHLTLDSHRTGTGIYGNLPTLAETLYGEALSIRGAALVHVLHLSMLAAFILLAAGVVRTCWGARPAALAAVGISLYPELVQNAITGYIDAAATAFEAGAALLLVLWAVRGQRGDAAAGALLVGFAMGVKYTALPTAGLAALLVAVAAIRERSRRLPLVLAAIGLTACGYWYAKNLVRYGNPVYPIALGHPGISDALYRGWLADVQHFGTNAWTRTVTGFLDIPSRFDETASFIPFAAFAVAPFSLVARGSRRAAALLLVYAAAYATYWYWLDSNQTRFLMPAIVVAIVLAAVAVGAARRPFWVGAVAVAALALAFQDHVRHHSFSFDFRTPVSTWLDANQTRYALGLESRSTWLHDHFGCQVDAVDTLAKRRMSGGVALWWLDGTMYYPTYNRLAPIHVDEPTTAMVRWDLERLGFRYALTQGTGIRQLSPYAAVKQVLAESRPFWSKGECTLYRLALRAAK
jgi:hypothetical protein